MKNFCQLSLNALLCLLFLPMTTQAQIVIDQSVTPEELVTDHLVGTGMNVSNVTFNMLPGNELNTQIGLFSGQSDFIEFDEGLVMATGDAQVALGGFGTVNPNITADPDLLVAANSGGTSYTVNHCAILEFDFVPDFQFLSVGYVFASMEYPNYSCSNFNDVFGFFVSGPGISGPYSNDAINIAVIPNSNTPVGINTINGGPTGGGIHQNCLNANPNYIQDSIYFVNNPSPDLDEIQFPGMTTNLYANYILQVGETYHIKLAIADVSDGALDSGVFLEGASFSAFPLTSDGEELTQPVVMTVFPNPANDIINLDIRTHQAMDLSVRVIDATGKVVMQPISNIQIQGQHLQTLDISDLSQGIYYLELTDLNSGNKHVSHIQKVN